MVRMKIGWGPGLIHKRGVALFRAEEKPHALVNPVGLLAAAMALRLRLSLEEPVRRSKAQWGVWIDLV